jgi:hypothetical protein
MSLQQGRLLTRTSCDNLSVTHHLSPVLMEKTAFKPDTRYIVTWRGPDGKPRPANFYVFRVYDAFMIGRMTQGEGLLHKILYEDVLKIVREEAVSPERRYFIPAAVLEESNWQDRTAMERYSSAPGLGK